MSSLAAPRLRLRRRRLPRPPRWKILAILFLVWCGISLYRDLLAIAEAAGPRHIIQASIDLGLCIAWFWTLWTPILDPEQRRMPWNRFLVWWTPALGRCLIGWIVLNAVLSMAGVD